MLDMNLTESEVCDEVGLVWEDYYSNSSYCSQLINKLMEGRHHAYLTHFLLASQRLGKA